MQFEFDNAICYSGYRDGQSPHDGHFPTYEQIFEDLRLLAPHWKYLRLYDCGPHARTVLKVIRNEGLDLKVMLGADMAAELSNPDCPWGADFDADTLFVFVRIGKRFKKRIDADSDYAFVDNPL